MVLSLEGVEELDKPESGFMSTYDDGKIGQKVFLDHEYELEKYSTDQPGPKVG